MSSYRNYYDSSTYGKNRESRTSSISSDRPATVTAKYTSTPSYKSSSIPVLNDTRSTREETPISTITNRYASYNKTATTDKPISKYEKKDYSKLAVPSINTTRSRDVSPVSKYSISRTSRHTSPERRLTKSFKDKSQDLSSVDRDKDIPIKTDKTSSYSSLSNYKIYPRTQSYSKPSPVTRVESKPELTVNRYAIANRLASSSYLRSPTPIKRTSISPIDHLETTKTDTDKHKLTKIIAEEKTEKQNEDSKICSPNGTEVIVDKNDEIEKIAVITRHTSPTPPGSSAYVRMRRADMAKTVEKILTRTRKRPEMIDKEIQSDRLDDPTRASRFGSTSRTSVTNWTYYSPNSTNYTGYAGRYSTQYSNLRENKRSSRSRSKEPIPVDNQNSYSNLDENDVGKCTVNSHLDENTSLEEAKETSEIIINVNLKLKKSNSLQSTVTPTELLTPEITVTNNHQLPPQPPKSENVSKIKKVKVRKSSTDSSSDSTSSKKVVKKRSKSASSTDSEQNSEKGPQLKDLSKAASKGLSKTSSTTNVPNGISKLKYSKSRESNSPESSVTLSTQSSISEDETVLKSKTNDVSKSASSETAISNDNTNMQVSKSEGTEEAKSFLIRALAPVTNLFKLRHQDSIENSRLIENAEISSKDSTNLADSGPNKSKNIIASNDEALVKLKAIRPLETNDQKVPLKLNCFTDDEKPWWLDSNANIPEGIERLTPPRKSSSDSDKSEKLNLFQIKPNESGERKDWRLTSNDNVISINKQDSQNSLALSKSGSDQRNFQLRRIRHIESGERPWWLSSSKNIPEGIEKLPTPPPQPDSDSSDSEEVEVYVSCTQVPPFPLQLPDDEPLGDRRSPEGLETPNDDYRVGRRSPYENNRHYRRESLKLPYQKGAQKYISRYTDIDDILGTSGHIYSPFMDSILAKRTGQSPFDDDECEEIDPTQVRIHDSTAQMPIIKKLRCRNEIIEYRNEDQVSHRERSAKWQIRLCIPLSPAPGGPNASILGTVAIHDFESQRMYSVQWTGRQRYAEIVAFGDLCSLATPLGTQREASSPLLSVSLTNAVETRHVQSLKFIIETRELDDVTFQVFKDGEYGAYLDLDLSLSEQQEEIEGLEVRQASDDTGLGSSCQDLSEATTATLDSDDDLEDFQDAYEHFDDRKNALVLRTQLSVRVDAIIEKLLHAEGRELRRALFTLKQILQQDKDLVHEFVANKGLDCLMQVANTADHNYLDYILRALGQILLYVDGMHGVMKHKKCIQWLYSLISSRFRHVVKTALKLLLVFVEYAEKNCLMLINAIHTVDSEEERPPWFNIMKILQDFDASDAELLIYATTLINRCLNNVSDRSIYYDQVDVLQDQGIDETIQLYMSKKETDLDLLRQLQIFEAVLMFEDGDESGIALKELDETLISCVMRRSLDLKTSEQRKSKKRIARENGSKVSTPVTPEPEPDRLSSRQSLPSILDTKENKELSTALKRRRDRYARQAHHITQQKELLNITNGLLEKNDWSNKSYGIFSSTPIHKYTNGTNGTNGINGTNGTNGTVVYNSNDIKEQEDEKYRKTNLPDVLMNGYHRYTTGIKQRIQGGSLGHSASATDTLSIARQLDFSPEPKDDREILLNREHIIKDLTQRLTSTVSPTEEKPIRVSEMAGIVSKAKEELAKSKSKEIVKSPSMEKSPKTIELKASENDLHWEELKKSCKNRDFHLCDLDFSDLRYDSDDETESAGACSLPPPPPTLPPPPPGMLPGIPPPMPSSSFFSLPKNLPSISSTSMTDSPTEKSATLKKNKKTVKLFWREIQENPTPPPVRPKVGGFIWDDLPEISLDTNTLEHLFEARTNDLVLKKLMEPKRNLILDTKRSNAISIAMKKLPTPQTIKVAIMKMDATVIGREGIEKLLTMLPTQEEKLKIQEAQFANPDLPLGSAEQFLLTLASINELPSRLKLWVFKLDFDNLEKEIAEPLMDLKQGIELLKVNKTFKVILSTLRSVGSFLNGTAVKGFRLEYLSKVMEVKDTVHKHPLLYHICEMIIEKFPDTTDFFSEVGPVIRASKVDFDILSSNLSKLEADCKASWDHMKRVAKHDGSQMFKTKMNEFLTDAAERIILLSIVKKRVMSRYIKFLLYLGVPTSDTTKTKPSELLKVIAEFALEFRTTRERVLQQLEKRANHRERNKTRGKMIIDVGNYANKCDATADSALKELLKSRPDTVCVGRRKPSKPTNDIKEPVKCESDSSIKASGLKVNRKFTPQKL